MYAFVLTETYFHFHLEILFDTVPISLGLGVYRSLEFLGSLNPHVITEFQDSKWRIQYGGSKISNGRSKVWKLLYFYKDKELKVSEAAESKFEDRTSKFKIAGSI